MLLQMFESGQGGNHNYVDEDAISRKKFPFQWDVNLPFHVSILDIGYV